MNSKVALIVQGLLVVASSCFGVASRAQSVVAEHGIQLNSAKFAAISNSDLLLLGEVTYVQATKFQFELLGQSVTLPIAQRNLQLSAGSFVAVYGVIKPDGSYGVSSVRELPVEVVPGATLLYVKGALTSVEYATGTALIGQLAIKYINALHSLVAQDLGVGRVASFIGLQYNNAATLYAENGIVHTVAGPTSEQSGRGATLGQTVSGASVLGQTGSGVVTLGQTGSGVNVLGQTGSGANVLGQTGSGVITLGQTGSGVNVLGQTGSGVITLGQTGSGANVLGQTGSGATVLGQSSGGAKSMGGTGSGATALGMAGVNSKASHQIGVGVKAEGQTGSGTPSL